MMATLIYLLCTLTCLVSFALLWRGWRAQRSRMLFWSALCFAGLSLNNFVLVVDKLVFTDTDLTTLRLVVALVAILLLLWGLVWEEE